MSLPVRPATFKLLVDFAARQSPQRIYITSPLRHYPCDPPPRRPPREFAPVRRAAHAGPHPSWTRPAVSPPPPHRVRAGHCTVPSRADGRSMKRRRHRAAGVSSKISRALLGGGAFERPPPLRFFEDSKKTAARSAAGFSPTLSPIFSATFVKISTQFHVRPGHQVRSSDPTTK